MKLNKTIVKRAAAKIGINTRVVSLATLARGIRVELEHGTVSSKTNVTGDNILKTAKIATAHLAEFPDYYTALAKMEKKLEKKWKNKKRPSIFK